MAEFLKYATRLRDSVTYYARGLYQQLSQKDVFLWAQAIAFKVLVTIVPVIILATGILGQVLEREKPFETVASFLRNFVPPDQSDALITFLQRLSGAGNFFTIVGVVGLLFSAMTLFTSLRITVGNVFQEEWHEERSILGGYVFDLRMVLQVGLVFLLTIGLSVTVQTLNTAGFEFIQSVGLDYVWVREGWRRTFTLLGLVIPFLLTIVMFFQLYYFVPKPHPMKRSVLIGAFISAALWEMAKYGFTWYAAHVGRFDRYSGVGEDTGLGTLGDTFGLIIAFVFWVYFSGIVLCLGAIIALLYETRNRPPSTPVDQPPAEQSPAEQPAAEQLPANQTEEARNAEEQAAPADGAPDETAPETLDAEESPPETVSIAQQKPPEPPPGNTPLPPVKASGPPEEPASNGHRSEKKHIDTSPPPETAATGQQQQKK